MTPPRWRCESRLTPTMPGRYLSFAEREEVVIVRLQQAGFHQVAQRPAYAASTV